MAEWIAVHVSYTAFWLWVLCGGGAERLEGTFESGFLVSAFAPRWSAEGIKAFAFGMLIIGTIGFGSGYFMPEIRFWIVSC